jgi:hypothetical protein
MIDKLCVKRYMRRTKFEWNLTGLWGQLTTNTLKGKEGRTSEGKMKV